MESVNEYKNAWLVPTMNGRYYGGGMMATPGQDRLNPEHTVSVMVFHGKGKLGTLMIFLLYSRGSMSSTKSMLIYSTQKRLRLNLIVRHHFR